MKEKYSKQKKGLEALKQFKVEPQTEPTAQIPKNNPEIVNPERLRLLLEESKPISSENIEIRPQEPKIVEFSTLEQPKSIEGLKPGMYFRKKPGATMGFKLGQIKEIYPNGTIRFSRFGALQNKEDLYWNSPFNCDFGRFYAYYDIISEEEALKLEKEYKLNIEINRSLNQDFSDFRSNGGGGGANYNRNPTPNENSSNTSRDNDGMWNK